MKYQTILNIEIRETCILQKHEHYDDEIIIMNQNRFICRINGKTTGYSSDNLKTVFEILALHFNEEEKRRREQGLVPGEFKADGK